MAQGCAAHVLVVHSDPAFATTLKRAFGELGFVADVAIDCRSAIRHIGASPPDIVCVNLDLPRDSGYDLCESIRRSPELDHVPILVISERHSPEVVAYAEEAGANAFLKRPFRLDLLAECVTRMLEMRDRYGSEVLDAGASGALAAE
jgi:two-component system chemotaxis response regulator CheY